MARRTRRKVCPPSPEEQPPTATPSPKSLHFVPVVVSTPHQPTKLFEQQAESTASIQATIPEPLNAKAPSESGLMLHINLTAPQSLSVGQRADPTETVSRSSASITTIPPSSTHFIISRASIISAAEARIEQEEIGFRAVKESIEAEISRLQSLIAEQKAIITVAREKRDKNIETAREIIERKDELLEAREPFGTASSGNDLSAVNLHLPTKVSPASSISSIPPELLLPILALVDMAWTPLRLVCKQWDSIIINNGHFWNDIILTSRPDSANPSVYGDEPWHLRQQLCRSLSAVQEALHRSKLAPLAITIDFLDFAGNPPDTDKFWETSFSAGRQRMQNRESAIKLVWKEISRIRTLSVFATGGIRRDTVECSFEPEHAVILEKLYIKGRMYDSSVHDIQFSQMISAANLRTLRFLDRPTNHLGSSTLVNWSGFIDISVERLFVDWRALVAPLTLPNLRILRLGGWSLETLQKLRTPRLASLVIHDSAYLLGSDVSHFDAVDVLSATSLHLWRNFSILDMLNIPTVIHIELQSDSQNGQEIDNKWTATIFKGAEARFPNLTSLVLCTYTSSGSIIKGLEHLPHLVDLCIDARHKKLAAVFWNDLKRTVRGREQTKTPKILPNLKRLLVRLYQERAPTIEELAIKAKVAREEAERPLTLLVLEWKGGEVSNVVGERRQEANVRQFPRESLSFPE